MPTHRFPFRQYQMLKPGGETVDLLRPTVDFSVTNGTLDWSAEALIDTGSPRTYLIHEVGRAIGVPFNAPAAEYENVEMLNRVMGAQKHTVKLSLNRWPDIAWTTDVWFFVSPWQWKLPVSAIFGVEGFLDEWAVTFLAREQSFVVEDPQSFEGRPPRRAAHVTSLAPEVEDWWRPTQS